MAENTVTEAALHLVQSFREANQAVAESIVASQERNVKFAQSIFTSGVEILKSHVEGTQALVQKIEQQTQQQQEAFQSLLHQSIFTSGVEILKSHVEGTQALVQKIEQQTQQQQEAFQSLLQALGQDMGPEIGQQMQKQQETFRRLVRELEQQSHQQQEAFQKLVQAAMEASKNLLYTPLSYYQQSTDATETISSI